MNYNPVHHEANKHCDLADHYTRELVDRGIITITHVSTDRMPADALTKSLAAEAFNKHIATFMTDVPVRECD